MALPVSVEICNCSRRLKRIHTQRNDQHRGLLLLMATAEAIQAQITAARQRLDDAESVDQRATEEVQEALQRQILRRELDSLNERIRSISRLTLVKNIHRRRIDIDRAVNHISANGEDFDDNTAVLWTPSSGPDRVNCSEAVKTGEMEWRIEGMSWLESTLAQQRKSHVRGHTFSVGAHRFRLYFAPHRDANCHSRGTFQCKGTLTLQHEKSGGITFRHSFFVKRNDGEFVQWGETLEERHANLDTYGWEFGPDIIVDGDDDDEDDDDEDDDDEGVVAGGIFGLDHDALVRSAWVHDDVLTIKVKLEVREDRDFGRGTTESARAIAVPPPTIGADLLSLFEGAGGGDGGDVAFLVAGERIRAHSAVLCARSEVFARELTGSMREAVRREVAIEECDAVTFRALLRFLYTDDLELMASWIEERASEAAAADKGDGGGIGGIGGIGGGDGIGGIGGIGGGDGAPLPSDLQGLRIALLQGVLALVVRRSRLLTTTSNRLYTPAPRRARREPSLPARAAPAVVRGPARVARVRRDRLRRRVPGACVRCDARPRRAPSRCSSSRPWAPRALFCPAFRFCLVRPGLPFRALVRALRSPSAPTRQTPSANQSNTKRAPSPLPAGPSVRCEAARGRVPPVHRRAHASGVRHAELRRVERRVARGAREDQPPSRRLAGCGGRARHRSGGGRAARFEAQARAGRRRRCEGGGGRRRRGRRRRGVVRCLGGSLVG